jgi:formate dehydrogenase subunit gamma
LEYSIEALMAFEAWDDARAGTIIAAHAREEGATLPILHALQEVFGCVPEAAIPLIADALNLTRAEVHGVVTFYHDFKSKPPGRHVLKLCRAEACQSMGGEALADRVQRRLGIGWGETTVGGAVTLEPIFCLGLCACAPAAMSDGHLHGRLGEAAIDRLLDGLGRR